MERDEEGFYGWQKGGTIRFDGKYGRDGSIWRSEVNEVCCGCKEVKRCLMVDQSEGEYNAAAICLDCIESVFKQTPPSQGGG